MFHEIIKEQMSAIGSYLRGSSSDEAGAEAPIEEENGEPTDSEIVKDNE